VFGSNVCMENGNSHEWDHHRLEASESYSNITTRGKHILTILFLTFVNAECWSDIVDESYDDVCEMA